MKKTFKILILSCFLATGVQSSVVGTLVVVSTNTSGCQQMRPAESTPGNPIQPKNAAIIKRHMLSAACDICEWGSFIAGIISIGGVLNLVFHNEFSKSLYIALPLAIILSKTSSLCRELARI